MERLEKIKELTRFIYNLDTKDLFIVLCLNEKIDYISDIEDISSLDLEYLDNLYIDFMKNDNITSIINSEILEKLERGERGE